VYLHVNYGALYRVVDRFYKPVNGAKTKGLSPPNAVYVLEVKTSFFSHEHCLVVLVIPQYLMLTADNAIDVHTDKLVAHLNNVPFNGLDVEVVVRVC
jgi:hypothetical protein